MIDPTHPTWKHLIAPIDLKAGDGLTVMRVNSKWEITAVVRDGVLIWDSDGIAANAAKARG